MFYVLPMTELFVSIPISFEHLFGFLSAFSVYESKEYPPSQKNTSGQ
jgi:hypothetical protein